MNDVIHDPATDWCACEPEGDVRCDYRLLADKVIEVLNPSDLDESEVSNLSDAIEGAATFIAEQPCTCTPETIEDWDPCPRCAVLGRLGDVVVQR
ncbi:MAG: hypothetical protein JWO67_1116 [Streptosporangiaceae bacterium]|nr:hypothetical protein [Streptosporangiaceae bacterium]